MFRILNNSKSGMMAQQEKLDSISNNLANLETTGYKKTDVSFRDMLYESLDRKGYPTSAGANNGAQNNTTAAANGNTQKKVYENGAGVVAGEWYRDTSQGDVTPTGVNTDLGIVGDAYFKVTSPNGNTFYTRDGSFVAENGNITDKNGYKLDIKFDQGYIANDGTSDDVNVKRVKFTSNNFQVDGKGVVYLKDNNDFTKVGTVNLYSAPNDEVLISSGSNLYSERDGQTMSPADESKNEIRQGALEKSNVNIATEMTDMLVTSRAFQLSSKGISTADEMWGMVNNLRK